MRPAAVIFDCDGVLVDSEPLVNATHVEMMRERGFAMDEATSLRIFAGAALSVRLAAYARRYDWTPDAGYVPEFDARLEARMQAYLHPVAGVRELIAGLSVPTCVASNGTLAEIRARLCIAGLAPLFGERLSSAADLGAPKPAPDVYLTAARGCGVAPEACAVIEDSVIGVTAAVRAGMMVFGYAGATDPAALRSAGADVFTTMPGIAAALAKRIAG